MRQRSEPRGSELQQQVVDKQLDLQQDPVEPHQAESSLSTSTSVFHARVFHNQPWFSLYRKNILRFLDPERDISIQKGTLKPGDVIHYVLDRHSTTNISETLYRLLPTASPMKNQYHRRCAIVGNSGILLNSSCGPEIDSHDFVIRFGVFFNLQRLQVWKARSDVIK